MSAKLGKIVAVWFLILGGNLLLAEENELDSLWKQVRSQCREQGVPGLALVIMQDNQVLLSKVYGFTDLEKKTPITPDTVFAIGSSSKPFTATLTALLVSEEMLRWDDPVTRHLPDFDLAIRSDNPEDRVTLRDLLSHRTGFFHMALTQKAMNWEQKPDFEPPFTRTGLLQAAAGFKPQDRFREKHNYSNVSMLAAAMASAAACGNDWDTLMREQLFEPLGMTHTCTLTGQLQEDWTVARGCLREGEEIKEAMPISLDLIAPAGGIHSSLRDMTCWLEMLLGEGTYRGTTLIKKPVLQETWKTQIEGADLGGMMPGANYGLGWFVKPWQGLTYVEHGGNALGFSANIALIPEKRLGYVMLSNLIPNDLQFTLTEQVWEAVVSDSP